eukprot:SAG22_NODE_103_length_20175_cov_15.280833_15_plen_57_part_00
MAKASATFDKAEAPAKALEAECNTLQKEISSAGGALGAWAVLSLADTLSSWHRDLQ